MKPNIVLVMCDDLGFGDVGFNGATHIQTPHLDCLAQKSIRLNRFYAGGPVCSPTRGTCLTGRHYIRYGINHANRGRLPQQERTLATLCREEGYATGHFGKWHLGTLSNSAEDGNRGGHDARLFSPPWIHGFDTCFSTESKVPTWDPMRVPDENRTDGTPRWGKPGERYGTAYWDENGKRVEENLEGCDCRVIMDRAEDFIRSSVRRHQPFLSVIWFHAPHTPVVAGPEWRALYPDNSEEEQHYYGCVSAMDFQVGRLVKELEALGVADNTIIWFCSDNGPEGKLDLEKNGRSRGQTGGLRGRKRSLYEGGIAVPALMHWPAGLPCGVHRDLPSSTLDIFPTCCAAMGIDIPQDRPLDGVNLLPLLENETMERPQPIPYRFLEKREAMFDAPTFALMSGKWKFLTNLDPNGEYDQLYDMDLDRGEKTNCLSEHPQIQADYRKHLEDFLVSCRHSYQGRDYGESVDMITPFQEERHWAG